MTSHPIHIPQLHHVTLKTTRMEDMVAWYGVVAGMNVHFAFPGGTWLSNDSANHRLALLASPAISDDPAKLAHTGLHHIAFEFARLERGKRIILVGKDAYRRFDSPARGIDSARLEGGPAQIASH